MIHFTVLIKRFGGRGILYTQQVLPYWWHGFEGSRGEGVERGGRDLSPLGYLGQERSRPLSNYTPAGRGDFLIIYIRDVSSKASVRRLKPVLN